MKQHILYLLCITIMETTLPVFSMNKSLQKKHLLLKVTQDNRQWSALPLEEKIAWLNTEKNSTDWATVTLIIKRIRSIYTSEEYHKLPHQKKEFILTIYEQAETKDLDFKAEEERQQLALTCALETKPPGTPFESYYCCQQYFPSLASTPPDNL